MMPRGRPKLSPQPECTMGTMASTRMPFQLKRLMMLEICVGRSAPTKGAMIRSSSKKPAMIRRGTPKLFSEAVTLSFIIFIPCIL